MSSIWQDIRYAARSLRRTPGFTTAALLTLALGIGANAAIFSVINGVLLRPLPYGNPGELVHVYHANPERGVRLGRFSPQDFDDLRAQRLFARLSRYFFVAEETGVTLLGRGEPVRLFAAYVAGDLFDTLQVPAAIGRTLQPRDDAAGADGVVVLSDGLWRGRFGASPAVVGSTILLDGRPHVVAGVMPRTFQFPAKHAELWLPISQIGEDDIPHTRELRWTGVVGRLRPDVTVDAVESGATALLRRLEAQYPDSNRGWNSAVVLPLHQALVGDVRTALLVVLGAVALVLLIAAANLANLLLARSTTRAREISIRAALGANRFRIARQCLVEGLVLALTGGVAGLLLANAGLSALTTTVAAWIPRPTAVALDATVVAFTFGVSVATGVFVALLPALRAAREDVQQALREHTSGATASTRHRIARGTLVVAETAIAVMLVIGAGLMLRSVWQLLQVDPGFRAENVLTLRVPISPTRYGGPDRIGAYRDEMIRRVAAVPGVVAAGASKTVPLQGGGEPYVFSRPGDGSARVEASSGTYMVTPGYFEALGIDVIAGRTFNERDTADAPPVLILNESVAQNYWPNQDPIGQRLMLGDNEFRVVGLVRDVRHDGLAAADPAAIYVPHAYFPRLSVNLFVRTAGEPLAVARSVIAAIRELDPEQPIADVATMAQVASRTIEQPRLLAALLGGFAIVALLLAAIGLYGVIALIAGQRRREIGVRMALGARRADVIAMVLSDGMRLAVVGVAIGLAGAFLAARLLSTQLFGVAPNDPATFVTVPAVLLLTALLASCLPAIRAARVDPMTALRAE